MKGYSLQSITPILLNSFLEKHSVLLLIIGIILLLGALGIIGYLLWREWKSMETDTDDTDDSDLMNDDPVDDTDLYSGERYNKKFPYR